MSNFGDWPRSGQETRPLTNEASHHSLALGKAESTKGGKMTHVHSHASNNLKIIKGIAEAWEHRLREIGVSSVEELAASDATNIRNKLQSTGQATSLDVLEEWIRKAQAHMTKTAVSPIAKITPPAVAAEKTSQPDWETFAEFFIDYQQRMVDGVEEQRTKVHRMRNGGKDKTWDGLAGEPVGRWMLEQLGDIAIPAVRKETRPFPSRAAKSISVTDLSIRGAELIQQPASNFPVRLNNTGKMFTHPIHSQTPFDLHVVFEVKGDLNTLFDAPLQFSAQACATNKISGEMILLKESEPQSLTSGQACQVIILPEIRLPKGLYRLQLIVQAPEQPGVLGFLEVPFLQVV